MITGYRDHATHLRDELASVELLVRAHYARWRAGVADRKPESVWGVPYVGAAEVKNYLESDYLPPEKWPDSAASREFARRAAEAATRISERLDVTADLSQLRLWRMYHAFELKPEDLAILLACLLPHFDPRYRRLYGYLLDDLSRTRPSVELLWHIARPLMPSPEQAWQRFSPRAPLFRWRLLNLAREPDQPLLSREVCLDDHIVSHLLEVDKPSKRLDLVTSRKEEAETFCCLDPRIRNVATLESDPLHWSDLDIDPALGEQLQQFASLCEERMPSLLHFHGAHGTGRRQAALALAAGLNAPLLRVDCEALLRVPQSFAETAQFVFRDARLLGAVVYWDSIDALWGPDTAPEIWGRLLDQAAEFEGATLFASQESFEPPGSIGRHHLLRFAFRSPPYELRVRAWRRALEEQLPGVPYNPSWPSTLAAAFQLTQGQIHDAVHNAISLAAQRNLAQQELSLTDLQEACRRQSAHRLGTLVKRIEPRGQLSLHGIILPDPNKQQLIELRNCIAYQHQIEEFGLGRFSGGRGIVALFAGASGTGKTMSAELLAHDRGVDLFKVDLSAVISKWVGETPKNLNRIFDEAESSNAILFFDEADSVFGKRSRISNPQDRWANLEVNFLLQRVESYSGVVILATNLKENIDEAFLRRIHRTVDFPFPDAPARFRIWSITLPRDRHDLTTQQLREIAAKFELSGGAIRNSVVDAAFRALAVHSPTIGVRHVVVSVAREIQKLGKPVTRGDFGPEFYSWITEDILAPLIAEEKEEAVRA